MCHASGFTRDEKDYGTLQIMWSAEYRSACMRDGLYRVVPHTFVRRNVEITEWSLVANVDLPKGTFLGFYSGAFDTEERESLYAAKVDDIYIYPFPNEQNISVQQRHARPFANMNEPAVHSYANCCMIVQDFLPSEVVGVEGDAKFFRGLACFTCEDVRAEDHLTWHYGRSYEAHRQSQGYEAGQPCKALVEEEVFVPSNSEGVLRYVAQVSRECVFPVFGTRKSERIPQKKRRRRESSDDDSSSSGSGHIPKYVPKKETRTERLARRTR